jgi:WD40 repeat protein
MDLTHIIPSPHLCNSYFASLDGHVYVWHRRTGTLFEVLPGHEPGGVNSVDWCPQENAVFASCGDDGTIRIWGPEPEPIFDGLTDQTNGHVKNPSNIQADNGKNIGSSRLGERHLVTSPSGSRETPPR